MGFCSIVMTILNGIGNSPARNIFKSLTVIGAELLGYDFLISFSFSVSEYTNAFAFTQLCGVLCAPWNGLLMDRHKRKPLGPGQLTEKPEDLTSNNTRDPFLIPTSFRRRVRTGSRPALVCSVSPPHLSAMPLVLHQCKHPVPPSPVRHIHPSGP